MCLSLWCVTPSSSPNGGNTSHPARLRMLASASGAPSLSESRWPSPIGPTPGYAKNLANATMVEQIDNVVQKLAGFHESFLAKYGGGGEL